MGKFKVEATPKERLLRRSHAVEGGCWIWNSLHRNGRANVFFYDGRYMSAYRAAYLIFKGAIPDGEQVCHSCDNPGCINPEHLWLGSQLENMSDMITKGRRAVFKGSKHGSAKLTECQARDIRHEYAAGGMTLKSLSSKYCVSVATIHRIVQLRGWSHVC